MNKEMLLTIVVSILYLVEIILHKKITEHKEMYEYYEENIKNKKI